MLNKTRTFKRPLGERRYRKMFILATEGAKTEHQYFQFIDNQNSTINIKCLKKQNQSSPDKVLRAMKKYLREEQLRNSDEAWLVVDKDRWTDEQLKELYRWSQQKENYGLAVSNPKFEYWILLHFDDGDRVTSSRTCSDRLKIYLENYDKGITTPFSKEEIENAIGRAERRDNPPCADWPKTIGTTVYRLVKKFF